MYPCGRWVWWVDFYKKDQYARVERWAKTENYTHILSNDSRHFCHFNLSYPKIFTFHLLTHFSVIFTLHRLHQIISQPSPLISGRVKHVFPFLGIKEVLSSKGQNLLVTSSHSSDVRTGDSLQVWGLTFTCSRRCPLVEVNSFSRCVHTVVVIVSVFFVVEGLCDFYWPQSNCFMTSGKTLSGLISWTTRVKI